MAKYRFHEICPRVHSRDAQLFKHAIGIWSQMYSSTSLTTELALLEYLRLSGLSSFMESAQLYVHVMTLLPQGDCGCQPANTCPNYEDIEARIARRSVSGKCHCARLGRGRCAWLAAAVLRSTFNFGSFVQGRRN